MSVEVLERTCNAAQFLFFLKPSTRLVILGRITKEREREKKKSVHGFGRSISEPTVKSASSPH